MLTWVRTESLPIWVGRRFSSELLCDALQSKFEYLDFGTDLNLLPPVHFFALPANRLRRGQGLVS
jgi:hypothetical protein